MCLFFFHCFSYFIFYVVVEWLSLWLEFFLALRWVLFMDGVFSVGDDVLVELGCGLGDSLGCCGCCYSCSREGVFADGLRTKVEEWMRAAVNFRVFRKHCSNAERFVECDGAQGIFGEGESDVFWEGLLENEGCRVLMLPDALCGGSSFDSSRPCFPAVERWPSLLSSLSLMEISQRYQLFWYRRITNGFHVAADASLFYHLAQWCHKNGVFIHPHLRARRQPSPYRDHCFFVTEKVPRLTPLLAIPERLLLGFQQITFSSNESECEADKRFQSKLLSAEDEKQFIQRSIQTGAEESAVMSRAHRSQENGQTVSSGGRSSSEADMCSFFFSSLNMMVSDVVTARGSALTDKRHTFADALSKVRTVYNAPYFDASVVLGKGEEEVVQGFSSRANSDAPVVLCSSVSGATAENDTKKNTYDLPCPPLSTTGKNGVSTCVPAGCNSSASEAPGTPLVTSSLADVLLQMIRNYIDAGPFSHKVPKDDIRWMVSVCLAHSSPLMIGTNPSIGIIPLVHLFPHGGAKTNTFVVARRQEGSALRLAKGILAHCGLDFTHDQDGKWIYLVPERDLTAGEEVCIQAMAPACDADVEAERMWRLSCGTVPEGYVSSAQIEKRRARLLNELIQQGEKGMSS